MKIKFFVGLAFCFLMSFGLQAQNYYPADQAIKILELELEAVDSAIDGNVSTSQNQFGDPVQQQGGNVTFEFNGVDQDAFVVKRCITGLIQKIGEEKDVAPVFTDVATMAGQMPIEYAQIFAHLEDLLTI